MSPAANLQSLNKAPAWRAIAACAIVAIARAAQAEQADGGALRALESVVKDTPELLGKRQELKGVEDTMNVSGEQRRKIELEIIKLRGDHTRLNAILIDATGRVAAVEERMAAVEKRLESFTSREEALVKSLQGRRALIAEILVVLQRMRRSPPPAILVQPEDMLDAIRGSMMLGSILPPMRAEMQQLKADLTELVNLRESVRSEKDKLAHEKELLQEQRSRLGVLIEARQESLNEARIALEAEAERARKLASQASSLKDLIARMESEIASARAAAEAARRAEATEAARTQEQRAKALAAPFKDSARLAPAVAFGQLKGRLRMPAVGSIIKKYGVSDGFGGTEKGVSIAARENGVVAAPCDGWVVYGGAYRTYGQLLIINAGAGYYVVLAGMSRINVNVGQFVLAGEPVASMGDGAAQTAAAIAIGAKQPILYVEFRKDGTAIDSSPWWAKPGRRKVGG
jgi:septal ring factor EnvC (AmiA/AmiB activator)